MSITENEITFAKKQASKNYLNDVKKLKRKVELAEIEYQAAIEKATGLKGIDYSRDIVSTSPTDEAIHNAVESYMYRFDELQALKNTSKEVLDECFSKLEKIDDEEATILRLNYLLDMKPQDIAFSLYMSKRSVYRKINEALLNLYEAGLPIEYRLNYETAL